MPDDMYTEAVRVTRKYGSVNEGRLQRRLHIPFKQARKLIHAMDRNGLLLPDTGEKYRRISQ